MLEDDSSASANLNLYIIKSVVCLVYLLFFSFLILFALFLGLVDSLCCVFVIFTAISSRFFVHQFVDNNTQ